MLLTLSDVGDQRTGKTTEEEESSLSVKLREFQVGGN